MVNTYDKIEIEREELSDNFTNLEIEYVDDSISYNHFFRKFMANNRPCVIKLASAKIWESCNAWVLDGSPNFTFLNNLYGTTMVPVANCREKYYNVQKKCPTIFKEYLQYWQEYIDGVYPPHMPCRYLKDWHFTRDFPEQIVYRVPKYFASDWLNEYLSSKKHDIDDYRFVYMGPKGSWTPLHADVFMSYSWSVNLCGQKRWLLFPPGQEDYLKDRHGNLIYDATSSDLLNSEMYPEHLKLTPHEVIQEQGEAIFVPTGWHHQVWNLKDTISINHNWINGCNIGKMWQSMQYNLTAVKKEIEDCQEMENWDDHCQVMLQAVFGMNYYEFQKLIKYISFQRLQSINTKTPLILYGNWQLGTQHIVYDLQQAKKIIKNFLSNEDVQNLQFYKECHTDLEDLCCQIDETFKKLDRS